CKGGQDGGGEDQGGQEAPGQKQRRGLKRGGIARRFVRRLRGGGGLVGQGRELHPTVRTVDPPPQQLRRDADLLFALRTGEGGEGHGRHLLGMHGREQREVYAGQPEAVKPWGGQGFSFAGART